MRYYICDDPYVMREPCDDETPEYVDWDDFEELLVQIWELSKNNPEVLDLLSDYLGSSKRGSAGT